MVDSAIAELVTRSDELFAHSVAELSELAGFRQELGRWLGGRASEGVAMATQLVVSELVTNAIEHSDADSAHVDVEQVGSDLRITVSHDLSKARSTFDLNRDMPGAASRRSRGLAVVGAIARSVEREWSDGRLSISAMLDHDRELRAGHLGASAAASGYWSSSNSN